MKDIIILYRGTSNIKELTHLTNHLEVFGKKMAQDPLELSVDEIASQYVTQIGRNENASANASGRDTVFTSYTLDKEEALRFGKGTCLIIALSLDACKFYEGVDDLKKNVEQGKYPILSGQGKEVLVPKIR